LLVLFEYINDARPMNVKKCKISTMQRINQIKISVVDDIMTVNREQRGQCWCTAGLTNRWQRRRFQAASVIRIEMY